MCKGSTSVNDEKDRNETEDGENDATADLDRRAHPMTTFLHTTAGALLGAISGYKLCSGIEGCPYMTATTVSLLAAAIGLVGLWLGTVRSRDQGEDSIG